MANGTAVEVQVGTVEKLHTCPQCGGAFVGVGPICDECAERFQDYWDEQDAAWSVGHFI